MRVTTNGKFTSTEIYDQVNLKNFIESLHHGVIIIDTGEKITGFNHAAGRILALTEKAIGQPEDDIFPNSNLAGVLRKGEAQVDVKFKLGKLTILSNQTPIKINDKIIGAAAVFQDITNLEENTHQLESAKELAAELNTIFENSYDGIYVTDATGNTIRVNSAYQRITGLHLDQLLGRNIKDIVKQGLISESITFKILKQKKALTIQQTISTGKEILVTGTPILNENGEISKVVTNVRDMSELNELQKKLEQSRQLKEHYEQELSKLRNQYEGKHKIIALSKSMQDIIDLALRMAKVDITVLILGESGVGKELIAQLIHENSLRAAKGAFIKVNCGAIPGDLLESELFGYEEGAFTGAKKGGKAGMCELADGGTLFLDEIADLPLSLQVKLLRVLQEREIMRLGGSKPIPTDIRLISATNKDLSRMVKEKTFREDLFYRINVVPVVIPPLRERKEDVIALIANYLSIFNEKYGTAKRLSSRTIDTLLKYDWPGNVRELINVLERLEVTIDGDEIQPEDLSFLINERKTEIKKVQPAALQEAVMNLEKDMIINALKEFSTSRAAANALKISQSALIKKAKKYNIKYSNTWGEFESD